MRMMITWMRMICLGMMMSKSVQKNKTIPKSNSKLQTTKRKRDKIQKQNKAIKRKTIPTYKETKLTARMIRTLRMKTIWMTKKNRSKKSRFLKRARITKSHPKMQRSEFIKYQCSFLFIFNFVYFS
jgi:hypothetical protein